MEDNSLAIIVAFILDDAPLVEYSDKEKNNFLQSLTKLLHSFSVVQIQQFVSIIDMLLYIVWEFSSQINGFDIFYSFSFEVVLCYVGV